MTVFQYVTLLRGINVGGYNIIKMTDLKSCFDSMGFTGILTYIQSGNVIFSSEEKDKIILTNKIEQELSGKFNYSSSVVLISYHQLKKTVTEAPYGFGMDPDNYRYDILFVKEPLTPDEMMKKVRTKEGVDNIFAGEYVLYFSKLISRATQSYMSRIVTIPEYRLITVRNWNTTIRLLELMKNNK
jgi:uncharacterized protein (DUF1697 family)